MPITYFTSWAEAFRASFQLVWFQFANTVPRLVAAIIILVFGVIIANSIAVVVRRIIHYTRIDATLQQLELTKLLDRYGIHVNVAGLLAWMVKWFILVLVFITVSDSLQLRQVTLFLQEVAQYIPQVVTGVILLAVGFAVAGFLERVVARAISASSLPTSSANLVAALAKWSVIVFSTMAALIQLGVAANLLTILFTGFVAMASLAGGLAFGLGGRDQASRLLDDIQTRLQSSQTK